MKNSKFRFIKIFISVLMVVAIVMGTVPMMFASAETQVATYKIRALLKLDNSNSNPAAICGTAGAWYIDGTGQTFEATKESDTSNYFTAYLPSGIYKFVLGAVNSAFVVADGIEVTTKNRSTTYSFYTVTFNPNGGAFADGTTDAKTFSVLKEGTISAPALTKELSYFDGWKLSTSEEVTAAGTEIPAVTSALTFNAVFSDDKNSDKIPDKYQKTVTYKVEYGTWSDDSTDDITETVTLTSDGEWDTSGSAAISMPTDMKALYGYENGAWDEEATSVTDNKTFTYTFDKIPDQTFTFNKAPDDEGLPAASQSYDLPYGTKIKICPDGGTYNGSTNDVIVKIESATKVDDAAKDTCLFMGWTLDDGDEVTCDYILKAVWEADENADKIPDKFQKEITFNVVNGTWQNDDDKPISVFVTLMKEGLWSTKGYAVVELPVGMIAKDGYDKGEWDNKNSKVYFDDENVEYTYTFVTSCIPGDVTGDTVVDATDLVRLKKYLAGQKVEINEANSDCNGDTAVDATDLVRLKKYLAGQSVILGKEK